MSLTEKIITILIVALGTQITRHLPFWLFHSSRKPKVVKYLAATLCPASLGFLVIYSIKDLAQFWPSAIAIGITIMLHLWKKQMLLSIGGGTLCYIVLVNWVFI